MTRRASRRGAAGALLIAALLSAAGAGASPVPAGSVNHGAPHHDWEGVTGPVPGSACGAAAVDPTCNHFYLTVEQAMRWVTIGAARDDCEDGTAGCDLLRIRVYSMDAAHTLLAEGHEAVSIGNVAAGATFDVQVSSPSGATIGLLPYLGYVRSCLPGPPCLPTTGR